MKTLRNLCTSCSVTLHDFTGWCKTNAHAIPEGFVTGHDFSRADKANRMSRASAPAKASQAISIQIQDFFSSLFSL